MTEFQTYVREGKELTLSRNGKVLVIVYIRWIQEIWRKIIHWSNPALLCILHNLIMYKYCCWRDHSFLRPAVLDRGPSSFLQIIHNGSQCHVCKHQMVYTSEGFLVRLVRESWLNPEGFFQTILFWLFCLDYFVQTVLYGLFFQNYCVWSILSKLFFVFFVQDILLAKLVQVK